MTFFRGLVERTLLRAMTVVGELPRAEEGVRRAVDAGDEVEGAGRVVVVAGGATVLDVAEVEAGGREVAGPGFGLPKYPMRVACFVLHSVSSDNPP